MPTLADLVRRPPSVPSIAGLDLRSIRQLSMPGDRAEREADRLVGARRAGSGATQAEADKQAAETVARLEADKKAYVEGRTGKGGGVTEKGVRQFMAEAIQEEVPSLDAKRADQEADRLLNQPVPSFAGDGGDFDFVASGITAKEGRLNPAGIEYHCDGGFEPNDPADYTPEQAKAIEAFKRDQVGELRKILGCS